MSPSQFTKKILPIPLKPLWSFPQSYPSLHTAGNQYPGFHINHYFAILMAHPRPNYQKIILFKRYHSPSVQIDKIITSLVGKDGVKISQVPFSFLISDSKCNL